MTHKHILHPILLLVALLTLALASCQKEPESPFTTKQKVIIDTDMVNAFDDGIAYLLLAAHPEVEILGVTTVMGNTWAPEGMAYAIRQGEIAKAYDTHFIVGAELPLVDRRLDFFHDQTDRNPGEKWHGCIDFERIYDWKEHYRNTYGEEPIMQADENIAAEDFIIEQIRKYPGEVTILAIGPCTNIAKALTKAPDITEKTKQIIYMGGAIYCEGNTTPYAEMNFFYDPVAAAQCLRSEFKKQVLVSLDVCNTVRIDYDTYFELYNSVDNEKLKDVFRRQYYYPSFLNDKAYTNFVWDVISAALVLDESLITDYTTIRVDVDDDPESFTFGKAFETQDTTLPSVKVPLKINNELFFDLLKDAIATY